MTINEQRIREFAYQIWESEGKPHGHSQRHWEMANKLATSSHADSDIQQMAANETVDDFDAMDTTDTDSADFTTFTHFNESTDSTDPVSPEPISPGQPAHPSPTTEPIQPSEPSQAPAQPMDPINPSQPDQPFTPVAAVSPPRKSKKSAVADAPAKSLIDTMPIIDTRPMEMAQSVPAKKTNRSKKPKAAENESA